MIDNIRYALLVVALQILVGCMSIEVNPSKALSQFARLERVQCVLVAPRISLYIRTGEVFRNFGCLTCAEDLLARAIAESERLSGCQDALSDDSGDNVISDNEDEEDDTEDEDDEDVLCMSSLDEYLIYQNGERMCVLGISVKDNVVCVRCPSEARELELGYLTCSGLDVYDKYYRDYVLPRLFCADKEDIAVDDENEP